MRGGREAEHSRAERCSAGSRTAFLSCGNFPRDKRAGKGQQKREGGRERRIDEGWDKREGGRESISKQVCQRIIRNDTAVAEKRAAHSPNRMGTDCIKNVSRLNLAALIVNTLPLTFVFPFQMPYLVNECF